VHHITAKEYIHGIITNNKKLLAKSITIMESSLPHHKSTAQSIISSIMPHTGRSIRVGITGVPGVGKSSFIEKLGLHLVNNGHKIAVLAVDPSSNVNGGSILADKTRMEQLAAESNAFIRPSPSSSHLGGVAKKTRETMLICEAAGYDVILVETVGVGQSETVVASMVDFFLTLMLPNAGDELQGIKKGVLELADAVVINKADTNNTEQALLAKKVYETAFHIMMPTSQNWIPPIMTCSALENRGIKEVWDKIIEHNSILKKTGELEKKRSSQSVDWMNSLLEEMMKNYFFNINTVKEKITEAKNMVRHKTISPAEAAENIFQTILNNLSKDV